MERMQQKSECDFAKIMFRATKPIERDTRDWVAPSPSKSLAEQPSDSFEREAHAISSLNHPTLCALYDLWAELSGNELVEEKRFGTNGDMFVAHTWGTQEAPGNASSSQSWNRGGYRQRQRCPHGLPW